jgi:hypothetical protein
MPINIKSKSGLGFTFAGFGYFCFKSIKVSTLNTAKHMDRYIQQLIEDLEAAAQSRPKTFYFMDLMVFFNDQSEEEKAMIPFKTIEELTGIKQEAFPNFNDLHGRNWKAVLNAVFEVLNSLNIKLVDAPIGMPKGWLYDAITSNWQHPVQYLPESAIDFELCTNDPETCPYGVYCDCGKEGFVEIVEIPEKYEAFVPQMARAIDTGMVCFLHADTLGLKTITQAEYEDGNYEINIFAKFFMVEPLQKYELFDMMETFTYGLFNESLQEKLFGALSSKNRMGRFNAIVLHTEEKQKWLDFKQEWLEAHVRGTIWQEINYNDALPEGVNGFFNDDGSRIDPSTVPIPSHCMLCKSFYTGDAEDNTLCVLNRNDQRNEPDFKCGNYESI